MNCVWLDDGESRPRFHFYFTLVSQFVNEKISTYQKKDSEELVMAKVFYELLLTICKEFTDVEHHYQRLTNSEASNLIKIAKDVANHRMHFSP